MAFKQHHKAAEMATNNTKMGWGGIDPEKPHQATCSLILLYFTFTRSGYKDCHP